MISKFKRKYPQIWIVISISFLAFLSGYLIASNRQYKAVVQVLDSSKDVIQAQELILENPVIKVNQINEKERKEIEDFVYSFEGFRQTKDVDKVISYFTPPISNEEKAELDFMMGKDLAIDNSKPLPRLFTTQLFNNSVAESVIKEISKSGDTITVAVDELRVSYSGLSEPPAKIGYTAMIEACILELVRSNEGYKINKYYRQSPNKDMFLKYEGLYSI